MTKNDIASIVARNNKGEQEAIEGYFQLLALPDLPADFRKDIEEIISDEMNHSQMLARWVTRLTGIKPNAM